jgi:DNA-binding MarR family transcriptional regulator
MILSNKQTRSLEAKICAYSKMLGKSEKEITDFLGYSRMTIKRRIDSLEDKAPELYLVLRDRGC